jgi:hypothetical protein
MNIRRVVLGCFFLSLAAGTAVAQDGARQAGPLSSTAPVVRNDGLAGGERANFGPQPLVLRRPAYYKHTVGAEQPRHAMVGMLYTSGYSAIAAKLSKEDQAILSGALLQHSTTVRSARPEAEAICRQALARGEAAAKWEIESIGARVQEEQVKETAQLVASYDAMLSRLSSEGTKVVTEAYEALEANSATVETDFAKYAAENPAQFMQGKLAACARR